MLLSLILLKIRELKKENDGLDSKMKSALTWMKYMIFKISISRYIDRTREKVKMKHDKKLDRLLVKRAMDLGTTKNPNKLITNLTDEVLTKEEIEVLTLGLEHGIALRSREDDILPAIEGLFSKIKDSNIIKKNHMATERVKFALRSFAYNIIDIENKQFFQDSKKAKVIKNLRKRIVILKPDKGQGVVLIKKDDYTKSMQEIFADKSKFKSIDHDSTITRVENIKRYIQTMFNRGEISEEEKKEMWMKGANRARARGLPKTHKDFDRIPPFRPIVDTTNTPYSGIGSFLKKLLYPLTMNEYSMKDTFHAVEQVGKIDFSLLDKGYRLVSFDVVSLFTNVPLKRTINIIVNRIYEEKLIDTKLRKHTLKKLILDCCTKTTFSFNDKLYEQTDGVCMGSSLGPVLANIIMTELEKIVLPNLINENIIKFYIRYVDDTLVMIKEDQIDDVLRRFNGFDKNLKFTVDTFEDGNIHFLDIAVKTNGEIDVYSKPTNTGQYSHFKSFAPWNYKIAWARSLFNRAKRICSTPALFRSQKARIGKIMSWNGFPSHIRKKLLRGFAEASQKKMALIPAPSPSTNVSNSELVQNGSISASLPPMNSSGPAQSGSINAPPSTVKVDNDTVKLFLKIPYMGEAGDKLVRSLKRKLRQNCSEKMRLRVLYTTNKLSKFCSVKDMIPDGQKNNVIYHIKCPGCGGVYVGKTECCLDKRLEEHATIATQPMYQHLSKCSDFQHLVGLFQLPSIDPGTPTHPRNCLGIDPGTPKSGNELFFESLRQNCKVLATSRDWLSLAYLEPLMAKRHGANINHGERAMRSLNLF